MSTIKSAERSSGPKPIVWEIPWTQKNQIRVEDGYMDTKCIGFEPSEEVAHVIAATADLAAACFANTTTGFLAHCYAKEDPATYRVGAPVALCIVDATLQVSRMRVGL